MRAVSLNPPFFFIRELNLGVLKAYDSGLQKRYYELVAPVVEGLGYEVYDLEYIQGSTTLRLYIRQAKTHKADLEDCVDIDRALTQPIQEADWIPDTFTLEVSSPGVYRQLVKLEHFKECVGLRVELSAFKKLGDLLSECPSEVKGLKKFVGTLLQANESEIEIEIEDKKVNVKLAYDQINKVHLEPSFADLMAKSERMEA